MKNSEKKLENQNIIAVFNILSTLILQGLAFFATPYFSRILGPANYGIVSVFNTWVQIITIVFFVRMNGAIVMGMTAFRHDEQAQYQSSILTLALFIFLVLSTITLTAVTVLDSSKLLFVSMMLVQGLGMFAVTFANSKFTYEFRADLNFFLSVGIAVTTVFLSIILIGFYSSERNYWGRIYGVTIPYLGVGIVIIVYILIRGKRFVDLTYWKFALPLVLPMVFHGISGIILNQSDRVMLKVMQSNSVAGIYSLAYTFSNVINVCWSALNNTWVPLYYDNTTKGKVKVIKQQTKNYLELFTIICIGFMLLAPEVYGIFASDEYRNVTSIIPIFVIGFYFIFLYSFPINYEIYYRSTKTIAFGSSASAFINIILNWVLIQTLGIYGAAIATLISYIIQFLFHYFAAITITKTNSNAFPFSLRQFFPYIVAVFIVGVMSMLGIEWYKRWGVAFVIGFIEMFRMLKRKTIF